MRAHQALAHRLEHRALLVGEVGEAERAARIDQRVLADQVLDLGLGLVVERVVGRAHVGELGVAALLVTMRADSSEYFAGIARNELSECHSGLPRLNRRWRLVAGERLAVLVEVGDVVHAGAEALVLAACVTLPPRASSSAPKLLRERHLLLVGDVLVVEHQHGVAVHAGLDGRDLVRAERLGDVDARDLADEERDGAGGCVTGMVSSGAAFGLRPRIERDAGRLKRRYQKQTSTAARPIPLPAMRGEVGSRKRSGEGRGSAFTAHSEYADSGPSPATTSPR